jgi:competence protein ComEC
MATGPDRQPVPAPLVPVAVALGAGIVIDRAWEPLACADWAVLAVVIALVAGWARRRERPAAPGVPIRAWHVLVLVAIGALGGAWHHRRWSVVPPGDLAWWIDEAPRPAWLRGVLVTVPEFHPPQLADDPGFTRTVLETTGTHDGLRWQGCTGRVLLTISGDRSDLRMGQPVTVAGALAAVAGPMNPGQFDARAALRAEGVRLRLSVGESPGIQADPDGRPWPWTSWLGRVRTWSRDRLVSGLDPSVAPLASALLLGRREAIDPDVNDAFARTGTAHILAISGLHLQALAAAVFLLGRIGWLGRKRSLVLVLIVTASYAVLVGLMPSVVRSAAMTAGVCVAGLVDRRASGANLLAGSAVVTLLHDPSNLFDVGCQLSFLCVAAIFGIVPLVERGIRTAVPRLRVNVFTYHIEVSSPDDPLDELERRYAPGWKRAAARLASLVVGALVVSVVVWAATVPLVALRFHIVSPIGTLLNVPLVPISSLALLTSGAALVVPWLAGRAAEGLLGSTLWLVELGSRQPWGHAFTPGPAAWWVGGFYALLAILMVRRARRWAGWALASWILLPVWMAAMPARPSAPEADILDVGHGLAVVIRTSPGRAVLYDCGRMRDPQVGRRLIARALWDRGVRRLDAVVLSHADADHYDGLPDLAERFPIGEVIVAPGFGRGQEEPRRLLAALQARGARVRRVVAGDRIELGGGLTATVRHPAEGWRPEASDNDRSLVLDLARGGHHVLLTGDLDRVGLTALLPQASSGFDAMLAPHHGGRTANPPALYDWANPGLVVVSGRPIEAGATDPLGFLSERPVTVLRTGEQGAVQLRWAEDGLRFGTFSAGAHSGPPAQREASMLALPASLVIAGMDSSAAGWIVGMGGLIVVAILAIVEWGAWTLVRPGGSLETLADEPAPWVPVTATAPDGVRLAGAWTAGHGGRVAVLVHGFGESRAGLLGRGEALARRGWGVALLDARGRGRSGGRWTSFGAAESADVRAWLEVLAERAGPGFRPVLWGRSMGAAIALRVAAEDPRVAALVLEAPYAELRASVAAGLRRKRLPGWLAGPMIGRAGWIAGARLDDPPSVKLAPRVAVPVLIVHGTDDTVAPASEVRRLAAAFARPPDVIEVAGARHVDVFDVGGEDLARRIAAFLDAATGPPHAAGAGA